MSKKSIRLATIVFSAGSLMAGGMVPAYAQAKQDRGDIDSYDCQYVFGGTTCITVEGEERSVKTPGGVSVEDSNYTETREFTSYDGTETTYESTDFRSKTVTRDGETQFSQDRRSGELEGYGLECEYFYQETTANGEVRQVRDEFECQY